MYNYDKFSINIVLGKLAKSKYYIFLDSYCYVFLYDLEKFI